MAIGPHLTLTTLRPFGQGMGNDHLVSACLFVVNGGLFAMHGLAPLQYCAAFGGTAAVPDRD